MLGAIAGGLIGGASSIATSAMNMREAEKNRDWQKMMSDTAHQREVKDLRAAGLNPILSSGGSGASTGSGGQASMSDLAGGIRQGATSGMQVKQQKQAIQVQKPAVTTARNQNEVLTGPFGKAYTKFDMLTTAGADPKVAGALSGLDEFRTNKNWQDTAKGLYTAGKEKLNQAKESGWFRKQEGSHQTKGYTPKKKKRLEVPAYERFPTPRRKKK